MPSLERFFNPQMRVFDLNVKSLPSARLYFFEAGSTTPKATYADKQGTTPNTNPVIASAAGTFPPIFIDGLYRVELRSSSNIVQPGWPIDNVGQDNPIVPYAPWSELVTYAEFERVTDQTTGIVYRSTTDNNLGNVPADSPTEWEVVIDPTPSSFTSNAAYLSWSDDGGQISLDVDIDVLTAEIEENISGTDGDFTVGGNLTVSGNIVSPTMTGTPTVPTAAPGTNNTQAASTAYVVAAINKGTMLSLTGGSLPAGRSGRINYRIDGGYVFVDGALAVINDTQPLFTMPSGFRPSLTTRAAAAWAVAADSASEGAMLLIETNGQVSVFSEKKSNGSYYFNFALPL